jgi:hypothetical protein
MREILDHKTNAANGELTVVAVDEPGSGGAHHRYEITGFTEANPAGLDGKHAVDWILFQNGPIKEAGVNGLTHEVLLAIVIDRLRCFQANRYASEHNALALADLQSALNWMKRRTEERQARGVEGTHQV